MQVRDHIEAAIRKAGSEAKLGEATGYSQHAIWRAKIRGSCTPRMAKKIHEAFDGEIPASALCPDIFEPAEQSAGVGSS